MRSIVVRDLPDEIYNELKNRAAMNDRRMHAEVRSILTEAVIAARGGGLGQRLIERFQGIEGDELSIVRDKTPSFPADDSAR